MSAVVFIINDNSILHWSGHGDFNSVVSWPLV